MAGGAAVLYAVCVVGLYRWYVWRQRVASEGFPVLARIDWETLIAGLLPTVDAPAEPGVPPTLPSGEPTPPSLLRAAAPGAEGRRPLLLEILGGAQLTADDPRLRDAGFTGGEAEWLETVSQVRHHPERALARLEAASPSSAAEVYLRELLRLSLRVNAVNRELMVFAAKHRLDLALERFGDAPALYFVRAYASALIGLNRAAINDLARAVYFSRQAPFYVRAVLESPFIAQARPALVYQCRHAAEGGRSSGEPLAR